MQGNYLLLLICFSAATVNGAWPRPESLVAFWPFDESSGTEDIVAGRDVGLTKTQDAALAITMAGPFGKANTSYSVAKDKRNLGFAQDLQITSAFTIAFYFYSEVKGEGGMLMLIENFAIKYPFGLIYREPNLVQISNGAEFEKEFAILKPKSWTFIAMTYDPTAPKRQQLCLYDETGKKLACAHATIKPTITGLAVGYWVDSGWYRSYSMMKTDAVACLMVYNTNLSPAEIAQLPEQGRNKGGLPAPKSTLPASESLQGFWPFNSKLGLHALSSGYSFWLNQGAKLMSDLKGPFGLTSTSYGVKNGGQTSYIGFRNDISLAATFTISFQLFTEARGNGAILWFPLMTNDYPTGLAINYLEPNNLEIFGGLDEKIGQSIAPFYKLIGRFPVLSPNTWNFVTLTYDNSTKTLNIFTGTKLTSTSRADFLIDPYSSEDNLLFVGYSSSAYNKELFMKPTDALACLAVYRTILTSTQIGQLPHACELEGQQATRSTSEAKPTEVETRSDKITKAWPETLIQFWPFDDERLNTKDIISQSYDLLLDKEFWLYEASKLLMLADGPFGVANTSYALKADGPFGHAASDVWPKNDYTLSMYYYTQAAGKGALLMADFDAGCLEINYNTPNVIEVWSRDHQCDTKPDDDDFVQLLGRFPIVKPNSWNFFAVTYNRREKKLVMFDEKGAVSAFTLANLEMSHELPSWNLYIGSRGFSSTSYESYLKKGDAISCLMYHRVALTPSQIADIPLHCERKGRPPVQGTWPKPDSLIGCWPLDGDSQLRDVAYGWPLMETSNALLVTDLTGPFGFNNSAFTVSEESTSVGRRRLPVRLSSGAFTVAFYFYTEAVGEGGIFRFLRREDDPPYTVYEYVKIHYNAPNNLEIRNGTREGSKRIGLYPIIKPNSWNFIAVTYDQTTGLLGVFDENGQQKGSASTPIQTDLFNFFIVGDDEMNTTDAIACLTVYKAALTPSQIAQLPSQCKTQGGKTTAAPPTKTTPVNTPTPPAPTTPWPRPQSLLGFWPMDLQYGLSDISPNRFQGIALSGHSATPGPFGDKNTAMTPSINDAAIFEVKNFKLSLADAGSFTVTLFFKRASGESDGGIFEFLDKAGSTSRAFQFRYINSSTIEVTANGATIGLYTAIQQKGAWTFIAFTFDASSSALSVYGKHGAISMVSNQKNVASSLAYCNDGIRLGHASAYNKALRVGDAVSCLMVYSAALTASEIRRAYDACRVVHGSAPCGSPKIPLSPIPSPTAPSAIPKAGQFPYMAAIRTASNSARICSATIIDAYWLLTSAQCFAADSVVKPSDYTAYVGVQDFNVMESFTRKHSCSAVITSGRTSRDIALVQLTEPIDFTNDYANDACLNFNSNFDGLDIKSPQFVTGWGKNGRETIVSQTLPRYAAGSFRPEAECLKAWGSSDYDSAKDLCFLSKSTPLLQVPCSGDEGSPLLVQVPGDPTIGTSDRLVQVGVYYKRDVDCSPVKPGLFANIGQYRNWIAEKLACAVPGVSSPDKCPQN